MDPQKFMEAATYVTNLKMYPYFDIASYIVMCVMVRDDSHATPGTTAGSTAFSRKHPLASWVSSILMCFAGSILANMLIGESLVLPFKHHEDVVVATGVWYAINYSPFDVVYKLSKILPIRLTVHVMKQIHVAHAVQHGVAYALKNFPNSYIIACIIGIIKGSGYQYMRVFERLLRGVWTPSSHEILQPSFGTKACLVSSIVFILQAKHYIETPYTIVYFGVIVFLVYFTVSAELLGIHDPFIPFENLICALFFGGLVDSLKRIVTREKPAASTGGTSGDTGARDKPKDD